MRYIWVINKCEINFLLLYIRFRTSISSYFIKIQKDWEQIQSLGKISSVGMAFSHNCKSWTLHVLEWESLVYSFTLKSYLTLSSPHFLKVQLRCLCLADWRFGRTILKNNFGPMVSLPLSPLEIWELGWKERSQKEDCLNDLRGTSSWILQTEETDGAGLQVSSIPC